MRHSTGSHDRLAWGDLLIFGERRIVDNRTFLLGLEVLYRETIKRHEREELLSCARKVAEAVRAAPANLPVDGYYAEDPRLTEYFRLVRALQQVSADARPSVSALPEFVRLYNVTSAPLYGRPQDDTLLPVGRDALSEALLRSRPNWTLSGLCDTAAACARELDDFSLVGLTARCGEPVVLAALRESVVLYAEKVLGSALHSWKRSPQYVWKVDAELARLATRFIDTFNALFAEALPAPHPDHAEQYWHASSENKLVGRCVHIGTENRLMPSQYYHWTIRRGADGRLEVHEFWDVTIWTTEMYRAKLSE